MVGKKGLCRRGNVINKSIEVEKHRVDLGKNERLRRVEDEPGKVSWVRRRSQRPRVWV